MGPLSTDVLTVTMHPGILGFSGTLHFSLSTHAMAKQWMQIPSHKVYNRLQAPKRTSVL